MSSSSINSTFYDAKKRLQKHLKEREHEYSFYKQFHILVGTFNVNNRQPPSNSLLEEWLNCSTYNENGIQIIPDIIAVGFQEIDTSSGAYIYDDKKKENEWEQIVRKTIKNRYKAKYDYEKFQLLNRIRLVGILLFVYVRGIHMKECKDISRSTMATGFMGIAGNKGGVAVSFRFYETTLCFVNCHFASGDGQTQRRNEDYQTIESRMSFTDAPVYSFKVWYTPTTLSSSASHQLTSTTSYRYWKINDHDMVFWFGDMNYRISEANEQVRKAINEFSISSLQEKDQLRCQMKSKNIFINYNEPSIEFMPTYKFDVNADIYDTSEKFRTPSWTDRILYHTKRSIIQLDNDDSSSESIKCLKYSCAKNIRFSDHRPVSGLYLVAIKHGIDNERLNRIRDELIREFDREENEAIPTIEIYPRPPAIVFSNVRYLDKLNYSLIIKNIGECPCICSIHPSVTFDPTCPNKIKGSMDVPYFDCLTFTPDGPYILKVNEKQKIDIHFQMKAQYSWSLGKKLTEIMILHVENGADTFITLDATLDMGPFGLGLDQFPPAFYDSIHRRYIDCTDDDIKRMERLIEMKNDSPALYISLIECLKERNDLNLLNLFTAEIQDSLDLIPLRDQIYQHNYNFQNHPSENLFMILLYLLQSLPEPLISRDIQDRIFSKNYHTMYRSYQLPSGFPIQSYIPNENSTQNQQQMTKIVSCVIDQLSEKSKKLFLRFLAFLHKSWATLEETKRTDIDTQSILSICIDILSVSLFHEHASQSQRHGFLLGCLQEEKKKHSK